MLVIFLFFISANARPQTGRFVFISIASPESGGVDRSTQPPVLLAERREFNVCVTHFLVNIRPLAFDTV